MGYKKIWVHLVYDVNHDGRHKASLVADRNFTDISVLNVYYGVVSLCGILILLFFALLKKMEMWDTYIGNAYLEANTLEKVYTISVTGFVDKEGYIIIIVKALYGLQYYGIRCHERFGDCLRDMGFFM